MFHGHFDRLIMNDKGGVNFKRSIQNKLPFSEMKMYFKTNTIKLGAYGKPRA